MNKHPHDDLSLVAYLVYQADLEPHEAVDTVTKLRSIANRLHKLYERACERSLTKTEEKREANLEATARLVCTSRGIFVRFNGDPRGYPVRLTWTGVKGTEREHISQPSNNWGGDWGM